MALSNYPFERLEFPKSLDVEAHHTCATSFSDACHMAGKIHSIQMAYSSGFNFEDIGCGRQIMSVSHAFQMFAQQVSKLSIPYASHMNTSA